VSICAAAKIPGCTRPVPLSRAEPWLVSFALTGLFVLVRLALVLAAGLGVRCGIVNGSPIKIDYGPVRIVANTNQAPNCNPEDPACAALQRHPNGARPRYCNIQAVTRQKVVPNSGGSEPLGGAWVLAPGSL
jgi:hypothetical protein